MPPRRILAPAGAAVTLLVVAAVAITQSSEFGGGESVNDGESFARRPGVADGGARGGSGSGGAAGR